MCLLLDSEIIKVLKYKNVFNLSRRMFIKHNLNEDPNANRI